MSKLALKEAFDVESKHGAFYTGGNIRWSNDAEFLFCQKGGTVSVLCVNTGKIIQSLGNNNSEQVEDIINSFQLTSDNLQIVTHHKSSLFKLWNWKENKLLKMWKSIHNGPVAQIALSNITHTMASGGSDGHVRLWDLQHHACTHNLKGLKGVVSILVFHPNPETNLLFAAADDSKIHGWNILNGEEVVTLSGHFSRVTSLSFHKDGVHIVSSGRDRVLILWDITTSTSIRVLPVYECVEGAFIIPDDLQLSVLPSSQKRDAIYLATAGEKGLVKIWQVKTGRLEYEQTNSLVLPAKEEGGLSIMHLLYNSETNQFAVVSTDHNIIVHSLDTFECKKQLIGYTDEILDVVYIGPGGTHIALATNSIDIKLYNLQTMNCQLLCGHTDIVLSLATTTANPCVLISSAKDNSVRVWHMDKETAKTICIACATRHTASVGSVATSQMSLRFFVSASQDMCLKLWDIPENILKVGDDITLNVRQTVLAHNKDINCVTISPNDKLVATGSQDKTAKLWSAEDLQLLGVFHGHRRGVCCVRFSPIDQVLLTTSTDCTIKLWSLTGLNCLKSLEGHDSSVLRAEFMSRGMQILTSGGDGLLKLWSIKTSECVCTLAEHESRIWTLAVSPDEKYVISGGSDSLLIVWRDVTEEKREKALAEEQQLVLEEQKLANLLKADELTKALDLALKLERPLQALRILQGILKKGGNTLIETINELKPLRKESLLRCAITWNMNSKNCQVAQMVISALLTGVEAESLRQHGLSEALESIIPYTERHFNRLTRLLQDLHLLDYTVNRMKPHVTSIGID